MVKRIIFILVSIMYQICQLVRSALHVIIRNQQWNGQNSVVGDYPKTGSSTIHIHAFTNIDHLNIVMANLLDSEKYVKDLTNRLAKSIGGLHNTDTSSMFFSTRRYKQDVARQIPCISLYQVFGFHLAARGDTMISYYQRNTDYVSSKTSRKAYIPYQLSHSCFSNVYASDL